MRTLIESSEVQTHLHRVAEAGLSEFDSCDASVTLPVSVIIAARNEAHNLARCLESLRNVGEIYVVDSHSTDGTAEFASRMGAKVVQFNYQGGWPKKRQWALDALPLRFDWVLLLDADEALTPELAAEMSHAIRNSSVHGYHVGLEMFFLGRRLRHCGATFYKMSLFRRGNGHFECRAENQDASMGDMEVHEHVIVDGSTAKLKQRLVHRNFESLNRYVQKHNEYSNWEAQVWREGRMGTHRAEIKPKLSGTQAQRRRWIRKKVFHFPGSPALFFLYKYIVRFGFLDGIPGLIYCGFQGIQFFHIKAKIYEAKLGESIAASVPGFPRAENRELAAAKD